MKRSFLLVLAIIAGALGALAIRVVVEGRNALVDGDDAQAAGRTADAIRKYETAARWYLPLAPHVDDAYGKLRTLAASPDPGVQLAAWRAIRGAARATRSLWTPHAGDLAAADQAIARLSAGVPGAGSTDEAWHRERLARQSRPSIAATVLAGLGILVWIGGALALARRGIDGSGRWIRRPALLAGAAIVVGVACWAAGLYNA